MPNVYITALGGEREAQQRAMDEYVARQNRRREAEQRAELLLRSHLTPQQKRTLTAHGFFKVIGGVTKNEYIIMTGYSQNIRADTRASGCDCRDCIESRRRTICYHMRITAPYWDHMLAQMLYIKYNEEVFLAGAYVSG